MEARRNSASDMIASSLAERVCRKSSGYFRLLGSAGTIAGLPGSQATKTLPTPLLSNSRTRIDMPHLVLQRFLDKDQCI